MKVLEFRFWFLLLPLFFGAVASAADQPVNGAPGGEQISVVLNRDGAWIQPNKPGAARFRVPAVLGMTQVVDGLLDQMGSGTYACTAIVTHANLRLDYSQSMEAKSIHILKIWDLKDCSETARPRD